MKSAQNSDLSVTVRGSCMDARTIVTEALATEGFGILTEIDVREVLARKLQANIPPYLILGACNPHFAHAALSADPEIGLLLPCNVVLREQDGGCIVSIMDPLLMAEFSGNVTVQDVAKQARERIDRVIAAVAARAG